MRKTKGELKNNCLATEIVLSKSDAASLVRKKFFFIPPQIHSMKMRYVPCWWVVLDFTVGFFGNKNQVEGRLNFIVDEIKGCGLVDESVRIKLAKKKIESHELVEIRLSEDQAVKKATVDARWKVVLGKYKKPPELELVSTKIFYRPYFEVDYSYGQDIMTQWIPVDNYGSYLAYR
ncbi:MAG TPA: hypothetical protein VFC96_05610 [Anaerovoracaceae bacterium]|nr:hypothetical protein [Anaerovoracaceae bacterium]